MYKNHFKNNVFLAIFIALISFIGINNVEAKNTAYCVYYPFAQNATKTNKLIYEYEDGKITYTRDFAAHNPIGIESRIMASNFVFNNKIECPDMFGWYDSKAQKVIVTSYLMTEKDKPYELVLDSSLSKVTFDEETKIYTSSMRIPYSNLANSFENITISSTDKIKLTAIASNKDITVTLDGVLFSDIFDVNGNAKTNIEINAFCYHHPGYSYCRLGKEATSIGGNKSPEYSEELNLTGDQIRAKNELLSIDFIVGIPTCGSLKPLLDFADEIYGIIIVFVIVGLIVLTMNDFMKAVASDKPDANQKAFKSFKTRMLIAILIILLPALLNFTFEIFSNSNEQGFTTCVPGL